VGHWSSAGSNCASARSTWHVNNRREHCSVVNGSSVGNSGDVLEQAPVLWSASMTIMMMRMDKLFSNFWELQHTAAVDKDHSALPIHHCQSMKTYMPILGFYPFWDSGSFGTSETVEEKKTWGTAGWFNSKLAALKLSGKIKYSDIPSRNFKWETEVKWPFPIFNFS
jgi:hypothetical protein